jgi:hypothetical protein
MSAVVARNVGSLTRSLYASVRVHNISLQQQSLSSLQSLTLQRQPAPVVCVQDFSSRKVVLSSPLAPMLALSALKINLQPVVALGDSAVPQVIEATNRNARKPRRVKSIVRTATFFSVNLTLFCFPFRQANRGKRPVSHWARRKKRTDETRRTKGW